MYYHPSPKNGKIVHLHRFFVNLGPKIAGKWGVVSLGLMLLILVAFCLTERLFPFVTEGSIDFQMMALIVVVVALVEEQEDIPHYKTSET